MKGFRRHTFQLILGACIPAILTTVLIADVILILQFVWKYIDELAGKDLSTGQILQLLGLAGAAMLPMALPIGFLVGTLMGFGGLAERHELMALKAGGVSFGQTMIPIVMLSLLVGGGLIWYSDTWLPRINYTFYRTLLEVRLQTPALFLSAGTFSFPLEGFAIYAREVKKQSPEEFHLHTIVIYEKGKTHRLRGVLLAQRGRLYIFSSQKRGSTGSSTGKATVSPGSAYHWSLQLYQGKYFFVSEDPASGSILHSSAEPSPRHTPSSSMIQVSFQEWTRYLHFSEEELNELTLQVLRTHYEMMNFRMLINVGDSLLRYAQIYWKNYRVVHQKLLPILDTSLFLHSLHPDSLSDEWDSIHLSLPAIPSSIQQLTEAEQIFLRQMVSSIRSSLFLQSQSQEGFTYLATRYWVVLHRRLVFASSSILLAMLGAVLGAIVRRGGLGLPLVVGGITFTVFYVLVMFGEQMARELVVPPHVGLWGAWILVSILLGAGIYGVQTDSWKIHWRRPRRQADT